MPLHFSNDVFLYTRNIMNSNSYALLTSIRYQNIINIMKFIDFKVTHWFGIR